MNESTNAKTAFVKALAIVGFLVLVIGLIWLLVQGLRLAPGAFSSLASIAETIENKRGNSNQGNFSVATEKTIVNAGDAFSLTWSPLDRLGVYTLSYTCTDNVSVDAILKSGARAPVPCFDELLLPGGDDTVDIIVSSDGKRLVDVSLSITFTPQNRSEVITREIGVTVVNTTISSPSADNLPPAPPLVVAPITPVTPDPVVVVKPTPTVTTPKPTVTTPVAPKPTPTYPTQTVSVIPQSFPNGFTYLSISFAGVGKMSGNETFTPAATFERGERAGIKFSVINIGTKTSDTWTFTATLPGGVRYTSEPQAPLKPNERATLTLGFMVDSDVSSKATTVTITTSDKTDIKSSNNTLNWSVQVTN